MRVVKIDDVTRQLVDDLLTAVDVADPSTWKPCWNQATVMPHNALTGAPYSGSNVIFLWHAQAVRGYTSNVWATYKQWVQLGGQVRKGQHGVHGVKWVLAKEKGEVARAHDEQRRRLVPTTFVVFNAAQQDGALVETDTPDTLPVEPAFEQWLAAIPHTRTFGAPAYWPAADTITMPNRADFHHVEGYVSTYAHELSHWTGSKDRLARDMSGRFGDASYAVEELVAEMSAAFVCARLGTSSQPLREDHAKYLRHWVTVLREQPRVLLTVAQAAERATKFLFAYSQPEADHADHDQAVAA